MLLMLPGHHRDRQHVAPITVLHLSASRPPYRELQATCSVFHAIRRDGIFDSIDVIITDLPPLPDIEPILVNSGVKVILTPDENIPTQTSHSRSAKPLRKGGVSI